MLLKIQQVNSAGVSWWILGDIARIRYGGWKSRQVHVTRRIIYYQLVDTVMPDEKAGVPDGAKTEDGHVFQSFAPDMASLFFAFERFSSDEGLDRVDLAWASVRFRDGTEAMYVFEKAYLCNDEGKTVEVIA